MPHPRGHAGGRGIRGAPLCDDGCHGHFDKRPGAAGPPRLRRSMRLLVIDDHPVVREGLAMVLRQLEGGPEVLEAADGEQGLALLAQHADVGGALPFGGDRLRALEITLPRLTDRGNAYQLLGAFSFESEKAQARELIDRAAR